MTTNLTENPAISAISAISERETSYEDALRHITECIGTTKEDHKKRIAKSYSGGATLFHREGANADKDRFGGIYIITDGGSDTWVDRERILATGEKKRFPEKIGVAPKDYLVIREGASAPEKRYLLGEAGNYLESTQRIIDYLKKAGEDEVNNSLTKQFSDPSDIDESLTLRSLGMGFLIPTKPATPQE